MYADREPIEQFKNFVRHISEQSLMDEVSATPKPGLVDLKDSGAHRDMDFHTFRASTDAIVPYITSMAGMGAAWTPGHADAGSSEKNAGNLFEALRPVGISAEKAMFRATCGVNTHKGAIFSMGLVAAAAGYSLGSLVPGRRLDADVILHTCRIMCGPAVEQDFASIQSGNPRTHGERLYLKYGIRGIRGEAARGFPAVAACALPALRKLTDGISRDEIGHSWNGICLEVLLRLMAEVDDTNVLYRADYQALQYVREQARLILSLGGGLSESGLLALEKLNADFTGKNISPGGCADLLAVTLFLWRLEQFPGRPSTT